MECQGLRWRRCFPIARGCKFCNEKWLSTLNTEICRACASTALIAMILRASRLRGRAATSWAELPWWYCWASPPWRIGCFAPAPAEVEVVRAATEGGGRCGRCGALGRRLHRCAPQDHVNSKVTGRVRWIGVEKGDKVKEDQILVRLEDDEFRAQYQQAQARSRTRGRICRNCKTARGPKRSSRRSTTWMKRARPRRTTRSRSTARGTCSARAWSRSKRWTMPRRNTRRTSSA